MSNVIGSNMSLSDIYTVKQRQTPNLEQIINSVFIEDTLYVQILKNQYFGFHSK